MTTHIKSVGQWGGPSRLLGWYPTTTHPLADEVAKIGKGRWILMFDDDADMFEDTLELVTMFDWIDPVVDVTLMLAGKTPIFVPHAWRYVAMSALDIKPHTYDMMRDCWVFMVDDQHIAHAVLGWAGVPYL